jgi:hypothetical protein
MKYENYQQAEQLVSQIKKHELMLSDFSNSGKDLFVTVEDIDGDEFYSINVHDESDHEYAKLAQQFVEDIKTDLQRRIDNLKSMLEQL